MDWLVAIMDWIIADKSWQWIFSGVGVVAAGASIAWLRRGKQRKPTLHEQTPPPPAGDTIHIQAGGDAMFAKDQGKVIKAENSQVGMIGDNARISGGIHFKKPGNNHKRSGGN